LDWARSSKGDSLEMFAAGFFTDQTPCLEIENLYNAYILPIMYGFYNAGWSRRQMYSEQMHRISGAFEGS